MIGWHFSDVFLTARNSQYLNSRTGLENHVPEHLGMATISEHRQKVERNPIFFEDALRTLRDWHSRQVPIQLSFLGVSGFMETVRASIRGLITRIDLQGNVTVSGDGGEIKLDLLGAEFSSVSDIDGNHGSHSTPDSDPAMQMTFPSGAVCLVIPCSASAAALVRRPRATGSEKVRGKLLRPARRKNQRKSPAVELVGLETARRNLLVDVARGQANIVEILGTGNGASRIRRLKEQFLTRANATHAERLKRQIVYSENGGAYTQDGVYQPKTESSWNDLLQLVNELEQRDGPNAWDRRRYVR